MTLLIWLNEKVHKPKEEGSCDAFVTVTEGMVLGDEIEQHGGLLLYTGIEVHTVEGLIDLPDGALERVVLLVAKKRGVTKLLFQHIDFLHSVLVGGVKGLLVGGLADAQPLIVVVVEGVERIGMVDDDLEECIALVSRWQRLLLQGAPKHLHQLPELRDLLLANALVHGISLDEVLLQHAVCSTPKLNTSTTFYAVGNRYNHVEIIIFDLAIDFSSAFFLNCRKFCDSWDSIIQFFFQSVVDVLANRLDIPAK